VPSTYRVPPPFPTRRSSDLHVCAFIQYISENVKVRVALFYFFCQLFKEIRIGLICRMQFKAVDVGLVHPKFGGIEQHSSNIWVRSEEHTSELQSRFEIVCRLLLETKNTDIN